MRSRATVFLTLLALTVSSLIVASPASAASGPTNLALQEDAQPNEDVDVEGGEGQDEAGEGQDDPDAESGASEEQTEDAATPETTGPPWTYQMARITLVLLVLLALGMGYLYYRLVVSRRKGGV